MYVSITVVYLVFASHNSSQRLKTRKPSPVRTLCCNVFIRQCPLHPTQHLSVLTQMPGYTLSRSPKNIHMEINTDVFFGTTVGVHTLYHSPHSPHSLITFLISLTLMHHSPHSLITFTDHTSHTKHAESSKAHIRGGAGAQPFSEDTSTG